MSEKQADTGWIKPWWPIMQLGPGRGKGSA